MNVSEFDFELPADLIAQHPPAERGASRLLVVKRGTSECEHTTFDQLRRYLQRGDLLVLNDTRVFPARLLGQRVPSGGAVECLLVRRLEVDPSLGVGQSGVPWGVGQLGPGNSQVWEALMHPGQKLKPGARVIFERGDTRLHGEVLERHFFGRRTIRLWTDEGRDVTDVIEQIGHMPLPPYIRRQDEPSDRDRYQTIYSRESGSVAAPTAGLHFTAALLDELTASGVERTSITMHVGYGTFKPVRVDKVEEHDVDPERYAVEPAAADALTRALREQRRIIAVGTTTTRALESLQIDNGTVVPGSGETKLFIHPGHRFQLVSGLITNFHLPKSSLLMLVASFAGRDEILSVYREAVARRYRFYSYGDAMLIR